MVHLYLNDVVEYNISGILLFHVFWTYTFSLVGANSVRRTKTSMSSPTTKMFSNWDPTEILVLTISTSVYPAVTLVYCRTFFRKSMKRTLLLSFAKKCPWEVSGHVTSLKMNVMNVSLFVEYVLHLRCAFQSHQKDIYQTLWLRSSHNVLVSVSDKYEYNTSRQQLCILNKT